MAKDDAEVQSQLKELEAMLEEGDKRLRQMMNAIPNALYVRENFCYHCQLTATECY